MQIIEGVYQLGGSLGGLTWTGAYGGYDDANLYAVRTCAGLVLFDAGNGETADQIEQVMRSWRLNPADVTACFLTHAHWDHSGGAVRFQQNGAALYAHPKTAEALSAADERCAGFLYHKIAQPCRVDFLLDDGQSVEVGELRITGRHFPGHTAGCMAYFFEYGGKKIVVSGDLIGTLLAGWFGWDGSVDFDKKNYLDSLRRFAQMDSDLMLPGHGSVYFQRPRVRAEEAYERALALWR